ncbi:hypothetical protein B0T16DRAFT_445515 [Cercophora newfieldiana]|uniref:Protein kinase domain-containing protein n=1 Tax=Cercophora newfieldiana TaxID=92897 RepID=A0AA39YC76_9PEZI|nr:hypothetical protein B0T16DRAFT_445515 [Cercophora newfieldiana]
MHDLRPSDLSPIILVDDPRLQQRKGQPLEGCDRENETEGYTPLSDALLLKNACTKDEAEVFDCAGKDIAMGLHSRVGRVDISTSTFHQESVILERGVPFSLSEIRPEERLPASLRLIDLVSRLHARGIVHGNVNPSALRWNSQGQLVFADFSNARLVGRGRGRVPQKCWDGDEDFVSPQLRSNTRLGRCFLPTESDDLFAMSVTLWCIWAGQRPEPGMFNDNNGPSPDLSVITDPDIFGDSPKRLCEDGNYRPLSCLVPPESQLDLPAPFSDDRCPQPTEFDIDFDQDDNDNQSDTSSDSDSDELDEEITWEFPFPFMQGLPCSPTDSMACLASPKGPPPPEFAVRDLDWL